MLIKNLKFSLLFPIIAGVFFFSACRKTDEQIKQDVTRRLSATEKLFYLPPSTNPKVKEIVLSMKKQNETLKFADALIKNAGYPRWEKAKIYSTINPNTLHTEGENSEDTAAIYVPFTLGNTTSAVLTIAINLFPTRDTAYNIVYPQHYKQYGFDTTLPRQSWNSRHVFSMFAEFDNQLFGHTDFSMTDGRILGYEFDDTILVSKNSELSGGRNQVTTENWFYSCFEYTYEPPLRGFRGETTSFITESNLVIVTICGMFWDDSAPVGGSGGGGGFNPGDQNPFAYPGGGGSGGGGGGGTPGGLADLPNIPVCPVAARVSTEVVDPCSLGWVPIPINPPPPPVEPIDSILTRAAKFANKFSDSLMNLTLTPPGSEYFFLIVNKGIDTQSWHHSVGTDFEVIQNYNIHSGFSRIAAWHSHPNNGDGSPGSGPSGGDLDQMWQAKNYQNFAIFTECSNKRFSLVIENPQKIDSWFRNNGISRFALQDSLQARVLRDPNHANNFQEVTVQKLHDLIGNSSFSGIGLYQSTNSDKTIFSKIN